MDWRRKIQLMVHLHEMAFHSAFFMFLLFVVFDMEVSRKRRRIVRYSLKNRLHKNVEKLERLICEEDIDCFNNLRLNKDIFMRLCHLLTEFGGLQDFKYVTVSEQVAIFLKVVAHHFKNRITGYDFLRSGHTVSIYFNKVLSAILKLHSILLSKPQPVQDDSFDPVWNCFKGCLGALDGTYVPVRVLMEDKPRYRNRKGDISTNVLAVCDRGMSYVYVLAGWEGSAADGRVLRDAVSRENGLKVPTGNYFLCDSGYANAYGFLTPYRGVRYHLKEWKKGCMQPQNYKEYFNMRHARARNVIKRSFGALKNRWAIFRSASWYPIKTQKHIIMACMLLNNFILKELGENAFDDDSNSSDDEEDDDVEVDYIDTIETSEAWNNFRDNLAHEMYNEWLANGNH